MRKNPILWYLWRRFDHARHLTFHTDTWHSNCPTLLVNPGPGFNMSCLSENTGEGNYHLTCFWVRCKHLNTDDRFNLHGALILWRIHVCVRYYTWMKNEFFLHAQYLLSLALFFFLWRVIKLGVSSEQYRQAHVALKQRKLMDKTLN